MSQAEKSSVTKKCLALALALMLAFLPSCGEQDEFTQSGEDSRSESIVPSGNDEAAHYDVFSSVESEIGAYGAASGVQFYQGQPVKLMVRYQEGNRSLADLYLYRQEGAAEILLQGLSEEMKYGNFFLDEEGCCYYIPKDIHSQGKVSLTKFSRSGESIYTVERGNASNMALYNIAEGKLLLCYTDEGNGRVLQLMDAATGKTSDFQLKDPIAVPWFGTDGKTLCLLNGDGVYRIDLEKAEITDTVLSFAGSTYTFNLRLPEYGIIQGFQVTEDGEVEILRQNGGTVSLETIQKKKMNVEKTVITLRGTDLYEAWLKEKIREFNETSEDCYVAVEVCGENESEEDYIVRTKVEMAAGKGPDILYGTNILGTSVYDLVQDGWLEELTPYMEHSGMKKEDYFPLAFCSFQREGGIYGINPMARLNHEALEGSLLEGMDEVSLPALLDELLKLGDKATYRTKADSETFLKHFLQGSDSLWGMVDWTSGTCHFQTELFEKLLQAAKNLGDSDRKNYQPVAEQISVFEYYDFLPATEGKVVTGIPFDNGFHGLVNNTFVLAVNAKSQNKEAAWKFISYLLSSETQDTMSYLRLPVHRETFLAHAQREIEEGCKKKYNTVLADPLTSESAAILEDFLEDAQYAPIRSQPLIDIILDGAQDYFNGIKDIPHVMDVIENRLNLYLQETTQ